MSGASPAYNVEEMTYALKTANAKFLMTIPSSMDVAVAAARKAGIPKGRIFLLEGDVDDHTTMKQLLEIGKSFGREGQMSSFKIPKGKQNKDVCGLLSFSSGTTGLPKAVIPLFPLGARLLEADTSLGNDSSSQCHCSILADTANHSFRP